jgi:diguanylate cyclase (GGDEF)-like protein
MDSYDKDYRYLLLNLIPQHRLPPHLRRDVELALVSGRQEDLRRQSVLALEELCHSNYLERTGLHWTNGDVIADYKRKGGRYSMSVSVPVEEWDEFVEEIPETPTPPVARPPRVPVPEPDNDREIEAPTPPAPPPEPPPTAPQEERRPPEPPVQEPRARNIEMLSYLPEITSVFSVSGRADPMLNRLDLLLGTVKRWLDVPGIRLLLLEDISGVGEVSTDWLETVTDSELRESDLYRQSIESGVQRLLPKGKTPETMIEEAPENWDYLGVSPVFGMGKVCGVLKMYFGRGVDEVTKKRRLEAAANLVKQAVEFNSQIETITSVDALTQVYNRHFYDTQVSVEIERATRSGNEVSMLVIDLDDFKKVNDELGHKKGDEALSAVADLVRKNLRKVDLPFRYGGEEFVVLLPGTSEFESVHTAERLRRVIAENTGFKDLLGRPRTITVSVGVSVFPDTASSADELFNQADAAMYRAKQMGKNRVVLYKQDMRMGQG